MMPQLAVGEPETLLVHVKLRLSGVRAKWKQKDKELFTLFAPKYVRFQPLISFNLLYKVLRSIFKIAAALVLL